MVLPFGSYSSDQNTQSTSVDLTGIGRGLAACSTEGGAGYMQVNSFDGGNDGVIPIIQHSSDDSTYATLITFTSVSATGRPTAERITTAATIKRYLAGSLGFDAASTAGTAELLLMFSVNEGTATAT